MAWDTRVSLAGGQSRACRQSRQALGPSEPTQVGLEPRPSLRGVRSIELAIRRDA